MNRQEVAEDVEAVIAELEADERPARRLSRRPPMMVGGPSWFCDCSDCLIPSIRAAERYAERQRERAPDLREPDGMSASWYEMLIEEDA